MRFLSILARPLSLLKRKAKQAAEPLPQDERPQESEPDPAPAQVERPQESQPDPVPTTPQKDDAQQLAEQLLGQLQPLWLKRQGLDTEVRFEMGRMLLERLYPSGQDRLPYGGQVMKQVSKGLGISPPDLHRMVKFARSYDDLASFKAQYPDVASWDGVKKAIAQPKPAKADSAKRKPEDASKTFWKRFDKTVDALKQELSSAPKGLKKEDAKKRKPAFEVVREKFNKLLSKGIQATSDS
jgi:hypothetical protein